MFKTQDKYSTHSTAMQLMEQDLAREVPGTDFNIYSLKEGNRHVIRILWNFDPDGIITGLQEFEMKDYDSTELSINEFDNIILEVLESREYLYFVNSFKY